MPMWWQRVSEAVRATWSGPITLKSPELARLIGSNPVAASVSIDEHTALTIAAVWSAVALIADDVASLPLMLYKRLPTGGKDRFESHRLYRLLHDAPNPEMTSMVWRRTMQAHALLWGNGYSEIQRDQAGRPIGCWVITPDRVTPWRSASGQLQYRVMNDGRRESLLSPEDVIHLPGLGFDGVTGYSVIAKARESMGLGLAAERFGATFFGNGSTFGGIITYPEMRTSITDAYLENNRKAIEQRHQGLDRAHKFLTLYGGAKYEKIGIPPNDAQFLETRAFQIRDVARWFKLPPHKLGDLADATYSNVEQQDLAYYKSCLRPWLELWEQELSRKLIPPLERNLQFIEHVREGFLSADTEGRSEFYSKLFSVGAITINEIRDRENLDPIPGGDTPFVPLNMMPLNRADEYVSAQIARMAAPPPTQTPPADDGEDDESEMMNRVAARMAEDVERRIGAALAPVSTALQEEAAARRAAELQSVEAAHQRDALLMQLAEAQAARDAIAMECDRVRVLAEARIDAAQHEAVRHQMTQTEASLTLERQARAEADRIAQEAQAAVEALQRRADEATTRADTARAESDRLYQQWQAHQRAALTARRSVYLESMGRLVRREVAKVKQYQATPQKLQVWAQTFYDRAEADVWIDTLLPSVRLHLASVASEDDPREVASRFVAAHFEASRRDLEAIWAAGDTYGELLHARVTQWAADRAARYADGLMREEVNAA